jgi:malonyl CoA-acyl carrier protein transacylase/phosphopantetheinyl transferase (holo-ACP synthase)
MDNCSQQSVLVGQERRMLPAIERLRGRGLIYERLPFDRPYHTPLFEPYTGPLRAFFDRWIASPPRVMTYTCATALPFPEDLDEVRELAVAQWVRRVDFSETIERMHSDGVRLFVEVGPKGMLCAFVDDILRKRPHLAIPSDVPNRSGTTQLNHLVGLLSAHGVPMILDHLYDRRSPRRIDLDAGENSRGSSRPAVAPMKLETGWPAIKLSGETAERLRRRSEQQAAQVFDPVQPPAAGPSAGPLPSIEPAQVLAATMTPNGHPSTTRPVGAARVLEAHFEAMGRLVDAQTDVVRAYLGARSAARSVIVPSQDISAESGVATLPPADVAGPHSPSETGALTNETSLPTSAAPASPGGEPAREQPGIQALASPTEAGSELELLLQLVSERTGYPVEMLDLDLDLEADLGIDSIKRVEILGSLQQRGRMGQALDLEALAGRKTLKQILDVLRANADPSDDRAPTPPAQFPLIGRVLSLIPGQELVAERELDLDEDLFLHHHAFGREISEFDSSLAGVPVVPLTMTIELLAEAASLLMPGQRLVALREVRGYRWIAPVDDRFRVKITARRYDTQAGPEIHVQIHEASPVGSDARTFPMPIAEARATFAADWPTAPAAELPIPTHEGSEPWTSRRFYDEVMFHGPAFQGVASIDGIGPEGGRATIRVLPRDRLFRSNLRPDFLTDPVLLDQAGQVLGFWGMQSDQSHQYVFFPFRVDEVRQYGPPLPAGETVICDLRITREREGHLQGDLSLIRGDGSVWAQCRGWEDRRFEMAEAVHRLILSPGRSRVGRPWDLPLGLLPETPGVVAYRVDRASFPTSFFTAQGAIWERSVASSVLGRAERELWRKHRGPAEKRAEWLLGRVAAKDATIDYLRRRHGIEARPADLAVEPDDRGRPVLRGPWLDRLGALPTLSIAHAGGVAAAMVGPDGWRLGIDVEFLDRMNADVATAFTPGERELLSDLATAADPDEWLTRIWCAKVAVAKALGAGMIGGPRSLVAQSIDPQTGAVRIALAGPLALWAEGRTDLPETLIARTAREGLLILAASSFTPEVEEPLR